MAVAMMRKIRTIPAIRRVLILLRALPLWRVGFLGSELD